MLHRRPSQMFMFDQGGANRWANSLNGGEVGLPTRRDWLGERGAGTGLGHDGSWRWGAADGDKCRNELLFFLLVSC